MNKFVRKISITVILAMFITMFAPASAAEAAAKPYLAYQTTEYGAAVNKLKKASEKEMYKVEKLLMNPGDKVDVCFINAGSWKDSKWTSSNKKVATVNGKGLITAKKAGTAVITLTYKKKLTNKKVTVKAKVYVGEDAWGVTMGTTSQEKLPAELQMRVGGDIKLSIYGLSDIDNGIYSVDWSSSKKKVAEIIGSVLQSERNKATLYAKKAGTADITLKIKNRVTGLEIKKNVKVNVANPAYTQNTAWDNVYYKMYGEDYKRLFSTSYFTLAAYDTEQDMLDEAYEVWAEGMETVGISGLMEITDMSNALSIALEELLKGKGNMKKEYRLEAIQYLVQEITDDSVNEIYVKNVEGAFKKAKSFYSSMKNVHDMDEAIRTIEEGSLVLKDSEVKTLLNFFDSKEGKKLGEVLKEGVSISEYMILTLCLYEADAKFLDELQKCSKPGQALYEDIKLFKKEKEKNPIAYFTVEYTSDLAIRTICESYVKLAGKEATALFDAINSVVFMCADMAGVSSLSDVTKATYLMDYISALGKQITDLRDEIRTNYGTYTDAELMKKIEEYELLYNTYLAMVEPVCGAVYELEKDVWNQELLDDKLIPTNGYDYNRHVAEAMVLYLGK